MPGHRSDPAAERASGALAGFRVQKQPMWFNGAYTYTGSTRANQIIASYIPRSQSCSFYGTAACTSPSGTPRYGLLQGIALSKTKPRNPGMKSTLQGPLISQAAEEACTARNRASSSCAAASMRPKSASDGRFAPCKPVHVPSSPGDRWQHAQQSYWKP